MGQRSAALILAALLLPWFSPPGRAQVPAQAATMALRGVRTAGPEAAVAFDVRDGRGGSVPGVTARDVTAEADGRPVGVRSLTQAAPVAAVWVLDASRRVRVDRFGRLQGAFAAWADSLRRGQESAAVVAAGRPPRLVQNWSDDRARLRAAVDNLAPRDDEADLPASLRLAAETCRTAPAPAARCAVVIVTDARDLGADARALDSARAGLTALGVPVYAALVGPMPRGEASYDALGRLVRASGGLLVVEADEVAAVRALRARLREGYVALLTGVPAGRDVGLRLVVRTADGRTLSDSATVRLEAPADAPGDSSAVPVAQEGDGRWKLWVGLVSLLVAAGVGWLFFGRRREDPPTDAPEESREELRPATPTGPPQPSAPAAPEVAPAPVTPAPAGDAASPPVRLRLLPLQPGASPLSVSVAGTVTLGREGGRADVAVPGDGAISARHAALERHGRRVLLRDLGSTNGTAVNGVPVRDTVVLDEGDVVRLGQTDLRVTYD
jgi:hypothetical protein